MQCPNQSANWSFIDKSARQLPDQHILLEKLHGNT